MWVPHKELKKKKKKMKSKGCEDAHGQKHLGRERKFFKNFSLYSFFLRFKENRPSEFVGINTESALRDEGYA